MTATKERTNRGLDANVPDTGTARDAYEVASTALLLEGFGAGPGGSRETGRMYAPARHAITLHVLSGVLHRIHEGQCNGTTPDDSPAERRAIEDVREIAEHYGLIPYIQGDPRGCSLYLVAPSTIPNPDDIGAPYDYSLRGKPATPAQLVRRWIDSNYTRGHAVVRIGRAD